jgi:hypothetical protein
MSRSISLRIVHRSPRRTRLKGEPAGDAGEALARVAERLRRCPEVEGVAVRPLTGSLIVRHTRRFDPEDAGLRTVPAVPREPSAPPSVARARERAAADLGDLAFAVVEAALTNKPAAALTERIAMTLIRSALRDGIGQRRLA